MLERLRISVGLACVGHGVFTISTQGSYCSPRMALRVTIYSGGQTGADIAGLNFAIERGIPHGGWCPRGRKAEDGVIPPRFRLRETPSAGYSQRTEWNVRDSDATVIFTIADRLNGGSLKTA